jgi:spore germination protein YaaH
MNRPPPRRPTTSQRRSAPRPSGPLRDPRLLAIGGGALLVVLVLLFLFIGPCSILNPSDDGDETLFSCPTLNDPPPPPDGLEIASDFKDFSEDRCNRMIPEGVAKISMPVEQGRAGRGLLFYTFADDRWQRVATAELTEDGKYAQVVVDQVPANGAIMRRAADTFQVMAAVPAGQTLHPEAERIATIVGAYDFVPAADGTVNGNVTNVKRNDTALLVPVVRASGGDEAQAVNAFIGQPDRRAAHATNLAQLVEANRLDGIELAYTEVDPARRNDFTDLVRQTAEAVHRSGGVLVLTLPLPAREGSSWDTGAYDWNQLGKLADYIKIAPERDQSVYRTIVPEALTYLVDQVEPKKLVLTISPLSVEKSDQGLRTMSTLDALSIASQFTIRDRERAATNSDITITADNLAQGVGGAPGLNWDAITATVAFTYQRDNMPRTVWIENQFSAAFKAEYVRLWDLGGVAVDDASSNEGLSNIWPPIDQLQQDQAPTLLQPNSSLLRPAWLVDNRAYQAGQPAITWNTANLEAGQHAVTLVVSDGEMLVQNTQRVNLRAGSAGGAATGTPTPTATGTARPGTATPTATPVR